MRARSGLVLSSFPSRGARSDSSAVRLRPVDPFIIFLFIVANIVHLLILSIIFQLAKAGGREGPYVLALSSLAPLVPDTLDGGMLSELCYNQRTTILPRRISAHLVASLFISS